MRFRLVPKDEGFYPLFDEAAKNLAQSARHFRDLLEHLPESDGHQALVIECERRGDELTRTILHRLNSSFVTPFDREDIHELATQIDDVVDDIQAAAELVVLHDVDKPLPEMRELADLLIEAADAAVALISELSRLRGTEDELAEIDRLESEADHIYRRSVARLFSGEFKAFDVLKLKDVVEAIENSVNGIENISDIVEGIVLKHA